MQDLPENHLRVSGASWVNIIKKKNKIKSIANGIVPDVFKISRVTPSRVRSLILETIDLLLHFHPLVKFWSD